MTGQSDECEAAAASGPRETPSQVARKTFRWDLLRGSMQGFVEACMVTFVLLVAIRVFNAPDMLKAILPGSYSLGLMISPLTIVIAARWGGSAGTFCAIFSLLSGLGMIGALLARELPAYLISIVLVGVFAAMMAPLLTKIYASNYSEQERGSRFSTMVLLSAVVGAGFSYLGGLLLDLDIGYFRYLYLVAAIALFINIIAFSKIPTVSIRPDKHTGTAQVFKRAFQNRVFCMVLIAWMFQGFGQVMTVPIRIEYLANVRYGIDATNEQIGLIVGVVPFAAYLLTAKIWGYCYDHWNFIVLRVTINMIAIASIATVFFTSSLWIIAIGMGLYGISISGGRILWTLWVVEMAPPEEVPTYMGIHSFFTGIRGIVAPFVAYSLVGLSDPRMVGWIATVIIAIGICIMVPYRSRFRRRLGVENVG
jgi:MFS family permease